jgi:hypothetical protein
VLQELPRLRWMYFYSLLPLFILFAPDFFVFLLFFIAVLFVGSRHWWPSTQCKVVTCHKTRGAFVASALSLPLCVCVSFTLSSSFPLGSRWLLFLFLISKFWRNLTKTNSKLLELTLKNK